MTQTLPPPKDVEQLVAQRRLVPSPREVDAGVSRPPARHWEAPEAPPRRPLGTTLRGYLSQLNVRSVTAGGPVMPLILLGYFALIVNLDATAFGLLLPEIKNDLGFSTSFLVTLGNIVAYVGFLSAPLMGYVADRVRRVTLLAAGAVVSHLAIALGGFAGGVPQLAATRAINGIGGALKGPVGFPLLTDWYPPRSRARVFAFLFLMSTIGGMFGPLLAGVVGSALGWRATLEIFGFSAAFLSLGFFFLREPKRGKLDRIAAGLTEAAADEEPQRPLGWSEGWRAAWSIRTVRRICYAIPFVTLASYGLGPLVGLYYAQHFHLDPLARGAIGAITTAPALVGLLMSGAVTDRILEYKPGRIMGFIAASTIFGAAGILVLVLTPFLWLAIVIAMVPAFFTALLEPATNTIMTLVIPARMRGFGLQTTAPFYLVGVLATQMVGVLADANGIQAAIVFYVPIMLVGAAIFATSGGGVAADIHAAESAGLAEREARDAATSGQQKVLVIRGLEVDYDGAVVIPALDLDIDEGDCVALLGTNGAGKSTLLRAILGINHAANGAIFLDGDDITHLPPEQIAARGVVMMPGGQAVFPQMTVARNLRVAAWMQRKDSAFVREGIRDVLERFPQLKTRLRTEAGNLSGGEQQMLAIGQALLMKPRLLMIDELSLGLAAHVVENLLETLRVINRQGTTVVIVEQSVNVALQVARRAVFLEKGQVKFDGPVAELVSRPDVVRSVFLTNAVTATSLEPAARSHAAGISEEPTTVLAVHGISLSYGATPILQDVSLEVRDGEVVGIIGPNGAGKTTLFDVIAGFAKPSAGSVEIAGRDVTSLPPDARARLGLVRSYQNVRLFPALTVRETIAVALERYLQSRSALLAAVWSPITRRSERRVSRRVDNLVGSLGLGAYADKFLNELSTGTRRIVDIACLLAAQPRVLLLDEPSSGLAQAETEVLGPVIGRIVKETGCAVVVIEHDLGLVGAVSQRLIAMRLGAVMTAGSPRDVLANPEVIDAILGGASEAVISRSIRRDLDPVAAQDPGPN